MPVVPPKARKRFVFLDLDDTLINTFERIIRLQEHSAAQLAAPLFDRAGRPWEIAALTARLLDLRRRDPDGVEEWLASQLPEANEALRSLRRRALARIPLATLRLAVGVRSLLKGLSRYYRLVLLTEGRPQVQSGKIARLRLARFFERIEIVDPTAGISKESVLRAWLSDDPDARDAVVVGNRIDKEIAAAARLGLATIWIRTGEGARRPPRPGDPRPTLAIRDINQLAAALRRLPRRPRSTGVALRPTPQPARRNSIAASVTGRRLSRVRSRR